MTETRLNLQGLPKSWVWVKVGEVVDNIPLTGRKLKQRQYKNAGRVPVIDQGQKFIGGYTDKEELMIRVETPVVVFGDHTKVVKYVDFDFVAGADGVKVLRPWKCFHPKLFHYILQATEMPEKGYARHYQFLEKSFIPLPPFNEQVCIVARLEELFARLDAGVEGLRKVKAQLKRYRQAVLKYAFEGKLTEEWGKTHKDIEPATKLLEKSEQEREKDPKRKEPILIDKSELPEIQESWIWTTIGSLFDVCSGGTPSRRKPEYWNGNIPWVSSGEVAFCEIKSTNEYITKEGLENSSAKLYPTGTVLMALYGEGKTRGQAAILRMTATTNQAVACILCANSRVPPEYVYWWLYYRYYETRLVREGANQPNMYLHHVRKMIIPVAPLLEQKEIILKIEESLSVADEIDGTVDTSLLQAERLRQSILRTAFDGKLVPQDAGDEPAEKLLERIKAERARSEGGKDTNRKKNKPKQLELSTYVE